ncbi:MAG: hydrogenase subunit MbhD domain-containing protein [Bacillota bacterium]
MHEAFHVLLLTFLVVCAVAVSQIKDLLSAVIVFAAYSLIMAVIWQQLSAPDIAMTEAAMGAGVTTLLLMVAVSKTRRQER